MLYQLSTANQARCDILHIANEMSHFHVSLKGNILTLQYSRL